VTSLDTTTATVGNYAELSRAIRAEGLLERRNGRYITRIVLNMVAFAAGGVAFVQLGDSWWQLLVAVFFAIMFAQLAFIGHDAGHNQIFDSKRANEFVGFWHGGMVGMSFGAWIDQHNRHHQAPNHEETDPDINIAVLAFTAGQSREKRGFLRWMAKHQAYLFFPLLLLEGFSLHVNAVQSLRRKDLRGRRIETWLLFGHFAVYLTAVFLVLSPLTGIVFILVHQCLWGLYMGCSFAPGHKGMPTIAAGERIDFLHRQVLTSRNISGGRVVEFATGGLNYQIEHHLFPTMPRMNLRRAQPIIQRYCAEHGIEYTQCGLLTTYGHVLRHLHEVSAPLRTPAPVPA
jgi:fatty acid desaturase